MQPFPVPVLPAQTRIRPRTALVASADRSFRRHLAQVLTGLRWQVREAEGGAEAWAEAEAAHPEALIVDSWLPDLDLNEFLSDFRGGFPGVDVVAAGASGVDPSPRGPYRQELLYALRTSQESDGAAWNRAPAMNTPDVLQLPKVELPTIDFTKIENPKTESACVSDTSAADAPVRGGHRRSLPARLCPRRKPFPSALNVRRRHQSRVSPSVCPSSSATRPA